MTTPPSPLLQRFARVLRRAREEKKYSVADLARSSGLSHAMVEAMEAGRRAPTLAQLVMLSEALGCTADALVAATTAASRGDKRR